MEKHGDIAIHEWPVATNAEAPVADAFTQSPAVKAQDAAEILAELKKMRKKTEIQALAADLEVEYSDEDTIDVLRGKITDALTSEDRENESPENQ
jgi:cytochrome c553